MLKHLEYVAAIIPESFINSGLFLDRLETVVSLEYPMFADTDCPVCLALFVPEKQTDDFLLYRNGKAINYKELRKKLTYTGKDVPWKFNDPDGEIGIKCIDNTKEQSIYFIPGKRIPQSKIKETSRSITRVSGLPDGIDLQDFLVMCNSLLITYRKQSNDAFLTSFKGLRQDNRYRRRLDFANARMIMNNAITILTTM